MKVNEFGDIYLEDFKELVNENTRLVSIMHVNNEIGTINDIEKIVEIVKSKNKNTLIHVDGVQGFGKVRIDLSKVDVDFLYFFRA